MGLLGKIKETIKKKIEEKRKERERIRQLYKELKEKEEEKYLKNVLKKKVKADLEKKYSYLLPQKKSKKKKGRADEKLLKDVFGGMDVFLFGRPIKKRKKPGFTFEDLW